MEKGISNYLAVKKYILKDTFPNLQNEIQLAMKLFQTLHSNCVFEYI